MVHNEGKSYAVTRAGAPSNPPSFKGDTIRKTLSDVKDSRLVKYSTRIILLEKSNL